MLIAGALLALFIAGSVVAMTQLNRWATSARLRSIGLAVAQQRVDQIMTSTWLAGVTRPAILTAGTATESNVPLNNDDYNASTSLISPYTNLDSQVLCTRTTVITDLTASTMRAVVTVSFTYRNRSATITLNTLRTTDTF